MRALQAQVAYLRDDCFIFAAFGLHRLGTLWTGRRGDRLGGDLRGNRILGKGFAKLMAQFEYDRLNLR